MNTAKRLQLLLSPVLIAMLALMLAVVSFGWYQAEMGDVEIEASGESVDITVEEPDYSDVQLRPIGDAYIYENTSFTITGTNQGYFGQTGIPGVESDEKDKPYIIFFEALITTTYDAIPMNDAFIDGVTITKENGEIEEYNEWTEQTSKFKVYFYSYSYNNETKVLSNQSETFDPGEGQAKTIYLGIHFDDADGGTAFAYSSYDPYYGSTYELHLKFVDTRNN